MNGEGDGRGGRMLRFLQSAPLEIGDPSSCVTYLARANPSWIDGQTPDADVVISSRVRLARNLSGTPFSHQASAEERLRTCELLRQTLCTGERAMAWLDMRRLDPVERSLLAERNLISRQLAAGKRRPKKRPEPDEPRGVAVALPGERVSVMVNEEDHVRIQVVRAGLDLSGAARDANTTDDAIEATLDYAYSPRFGYLTACPTNVGTGVRYSVMLHLPGLKHTGEIDKVKRAAEDMCLAVRGIFGEGSESVGDLYQLSNQTTLGKSEQVLLDELAREILPRVIAYERLAREQILERQRSLVEDQAQRAIGVLCRARLMASDEALGLLSAVRLGVSVGLLHDVQIADIGRLMLCVQPAHLQRIVGETMNQARRSEARARLLREAFGSLGEI